MRHQPVRTGSKQPVQRAQSSLAKYRSWVPRLPRHVRTKSHLPALLQQRSTTLGLHRKSFPTATLKGPGGSEQKSRPGSHCHLAVALAACLVAVRVEAFADITVAWATRGVSPPASGARLVNPAGRGPGRHKLPLPSLLGVALCGPSDPGCHSARFSVL